MGIKDYHTWIKTSYPLALIDPNINNIYDNIYIDGNYILHTSIHTCTTVNEFFNKICFNLDIIFSNFIAIKKIFFALDGTSSFSKIILQRERRNKPNTGPHIGLGNQVNPLALSPGTQLMKKVEVMIESYISALITRYKFVKPEITFSKSCEPDEGEIKICKEMIVNGLRNLEHNHLIIGNDADIIVLSMACQTNT